METDQAKVLKKKGIELLVPSSIFIGPEVNLERIQGPNTIIYPGCRLVGKELFIGAGCKIGQQQPATIDDCMIAPGVELQGGYFCGSVFLKGVRFGSGAHVRKGTIMEEYASAAHCVGLKQTVLFPWVTLGSLINFCDCLMAGGKGPKNHSEVGSSYIHFNFTPNQDKATASLMGDVPRGVMLRENPIFMGGQGGLVGPCRIAYGTILAAGSICRHDQLKEDRLVSVSGNKNMNLPVKRIGKTGNIRKISNNVIYIANLAALRQWYSQVRGNFVGADFPRPVYHGLIKALDYDIAERIKRLLWFISAGEVVAGFKKNVDMEKRLAKLEEDIFYDRFMGNPDKRRSFLKGIETLFPGFDDNGSFSYLKAIKSMAEKQVSLGTAWMQSVVDQVMRKTNGILSGGLEGLDGS